MAVNEATQLLCNLRNVIPPDDSFLRLIAYLILDNIDEILFCHLQYCIIYYLIFIYHLLGWQFIIVPHLYICTTIFSGTSYITLNYCTIYIVCTTFWSGTNNNYMPMTTTTTDPHKVTIIG